MAYSKYINSNNLVNFLLFLIPLSFIAGNLAINLNLALIILSTFIFYNKKIFKIELYLFDKLLIFLFLFILFTGVLNTIINSPDNLNVLYKTLAFFRYLIFYFIIRFLIEEKIFKFKYFFICVSTCVLFVCSDLIFQFFSGKDIFGNLRSPHKVSGPFGDELIAGSYIQRFSIFLFFLLPFIFKTNNKKLLISLSILVFIFIFFSLVISGNRMPLILFIIMITLLFIIEKKLRRYFLILSAVVLTIYFLLFNYIQEVEDYSRHFLLMTNQIVLFIFNDFLFGENLKFANTYIKEFYSGYAAWQENILFGGGVDSFYSNCVKTLRYCASHPHNYYLEILSELGIIGFFLILVVFSKVIQIIIRNNEFVTMSFEKNLTTPFILLFIIEIFPLKTSGSFFTTGNSTYIFFILAALVGLSRNTIRLNKLNK